MPAEATTPKTTAPEAKSLRKKAPLITTAEKLDKKLDVFPDRIDVRDWFYQPSLRPLPEQVINCMKVPCILDQGKEGACTGFALAAVINYHLVKNGRYNAAQITEEHCASPWMLYAMARRYDEWPGENYIGSSARGTIKGWTAHGVVNKLLWNKKDRLHSKHLNEKLAEEGLKIPAGAYYRVMHRQVRDMHAAIHESGILFATLMVHKGWATPGPKVNTYTYNNQGNVLTIDLPVIERELGADSGHAIAIVGYTRDGFIVQNSWGEGWGIDGFALLPYEDWLLHGSDCWVVQLGVPIQVNSWKEGDKTSAGKQRAAGAIPLSDIRPYVINIGNNGALSGSGEYWTTEEDIDELFKNVRSTAKEKGWKKKRIMLYLHGGLNSEKEVAKRVIAFREVCLANQIYPLHIMWETDFWSSLKNNLFDLFTTDDRARADWLEKLREGALEIKDRSFEITASKLGTMLWDEMKENAQLASSDRLFEGNRKSAMKIVAERCKAVLNEPESGSKQSWELHIVAHSAGAIFTAHALDRLIETGMSIRSIQFLAPAISTSLFRSKMVNRISSKIIPQPTLYLLSDKGERDDDVGPYGKSLLYLVSNSFERQREFPILGMERFVNSSEFSEADKVVGALYQKKIGDWSSLVIAGKARADRKIGPDICRSETHGGFDNDPFTLNSVLYRILGSQPVREFDVRDLVW